MLVGFNVSISDMGSDVLATIFETKPTIFYRRLFLIGTLCVVLPLCLLRRVELISLASSVAVLIYLIFLMHLVFVCGLPKLFAGNPLKHVRWWRIDGLVHCLPVIASSLCCQVQVHVIYNSLQEQTHGNMRKALTYAVSFVISAYALAGLFGYLAFIEGEEGGESSALAGNMLTMYPENFVSALVRIGFLYTVTASFPLMLFPLRSALNSLLFEEPPHLCSDLTQIAGDLGPINSVKEVPVRRFRLMTLLVILLSIVVSQCTDKVEVILSYTGSLAGAIICYILPACVYLPTVSISSPNRLLAVLLLVYGLTVFVTPLFTFVGVDSPLDAAPVDQLRQEFAAPGGLHPGVPDPAVPHRLLQIQRPVSNHPSASRNVSYLHRVLQ
uniref:Amino acid transporter transmembrane domain-containing protein n=2 Tax=Schistocephalus solidus TaxID=70667 RepID=A0A0X3Q835_SCHSO